MSERNVLTAIIVLLLPLSFGLDPGAGRDTPQNASMGSFLGADLGPNHSKMTPVRSLGASPSIIPVDFAANSIALNLNRGVFASSLRENAAQESELCDSAANDGNDFEANDLSGNCSSTSAPNNPDRSDISFPLQSSFSGSISTDENRTAGDVVPTGLGRQPTSDEPIPTPEPGSFLSLACGVVALAGLAWKKPRRVSLEAQSSKNQ